MRLARTLIASAVALGLAAPAALASGAAGGATAPFAHVIVSGVNPAAAVAAAGGKVTLELPLIHGVAATVPASASRALTAQGFDVAPDASVHVTSTAPQEGVPGVHLAAMDPVVDGRDTAGDGVAVGLVDTGVADSPDLNGRLMRGPDFSGEGDGIDHYGHGTFMAGLIAGTNTGIAPGARIVSVKVAGADGSTSLSKVIAGIGWIVVRQDELHIGVLSLSLGVDVPVRYEQDPLSGAVEAAWMSGLTVVVASGNEGPGTVTSPGRDPYVVTVGATDTHGTPGIADDTVAPWSGSADLGRYQKPEVVAPGTSVISLRAPGSTIDTQFPSARVGADGFRGSGTSMATALTAGAAAVLLQRHPEAAPDDVKGALVAGAAAHGIIDVAAADAVKADANWVQDWKTFDGLAAHTPWPGGQWVSTRWSSTRWSSTRWSGSQWASTRWSGSQWASTRWSDADWTSTRWSDADWASTRWSGSQWASTRWSDADWASTRWSSTRWSDVDWASTRWSSTRWSDAGWGSSPASP